MLGNLWEGLLANVVFVMFALPLAGACAVAVFSGRGIEVVRRIALGSVLTTAWLALLMVVHYSPAEQSGEDRPQLVQMATAIRWVGTSGVRPPAGGSVPNAEDDLESGARASGQGMAAESSRPSPSWGPNIRLAVGVDGISLWLVALTALLMIPATLAARNADADHPAAHYALLLLLQSGLIGLFAALDVVLFYICLEFTVIPLLFLIGRWGGYHRRDVLVRFFVFNLAGDFLILLGLLGVVLSYARLSANSPQPGPETAFAIEALSRGIHDLIRLDEPGGASWRRAAPWFFLAILLGSLVKAPAFPVHTWMPSASAESPTSSGILLLGIVCHVGCYGYIRFLVPLFPVFCRSLFGPLAALLMLGVLYLAMVAVAQGDFRKLVPYACLSQLSLSFLGLVSLNSVGVIGGLLHLTGQGCAFGLLLFVFAAAERMPADGEFRAAKGRSEHPDRRLSSAAVFAVLAVLAMPGLAGFAGMVMVLVGISQGPPEAAGSLLIAFGVLWGHLLVAWALLRMLDRVVFGRRGDGFSFRRVLSELATHGLKLVRTGTTWDTRTGGPERVASPGGSGSYLVAPKSKRSGHELKPSGDFPAGASPPAGRLRTSELVSLVPLAAVVVFLGLFPQFFIDRAEPSVQYALREYGNDDEAGGEMAGPTIHALDWVGRPQGGPERDALSPPFIGDATIPTMSGRAISRLDNAND